MLEPPPIPESSILASLLKEWGLRANRLTFLPLGADVNTAVYRAEASGADYFVKLRKGDFAEVSVAVPHFLHQQGLAAIIPPLATRAGQLWAILEPYRVILYPYISGQDGYERDPSPDQWRAFGRTMRAVHTADLPPGLRRQIPRETFSPAWRAQVREFQRQVEVEHFADPVAERLAAFMRARREIILGLVDLSEQLASQLAARGLPQVLCHNDIHPGNLLLPLEHAESMHLVDWDNPIYAPRERDLALVGGAYAWRRAEDAALFYRAYGDGLDGAAEQGAWRGSGRTALLFYQRLDGEGANAAPATGSPGQVGRAALLHQIYSRAGIDPDALRYYRVERVVVDIAEFCNQLLATSEGGEDREQSYRYFTGVFRPGHEVDLALG